MSSLSADHITDRLASLRIVPVVAIDREDRAVPLARSLMAGGIPCAEITFRTDAAASSIKSIAGGIEDFLVGAGTVLSVDQAATAIEAGASFIVSPGLNPAVVRHCLERKVPVFPGVLTPTEVERALDLGLQVLKFFPAEAAGGVPFLKALGGPYRSVKFIPTGGINEQNLLSYLNLPNVIACGGSWMVSQQMIAEGRFDEIRGLTDSAKKLADQ